MDAAAALVANDLPLAEARLRAHLVRHSTDVAALRMLAEVAARLKRYPEAQALLERCLELAPSFEGARHNYAVVLNREGKAAQALPQVEQLLAKAPRDPAYRNLKAAVLANAGDYADSIKVYEELVKDVVHPKIWMSYGHSLKTQRRLPESIAAYRHAIELEPTLGEVYWSLANLKTFRFSDSTDVAAMRAALGKSDLSDEDRLHFEFALGKALEDRG